MKSKLFQNTAAWNTWRKEAETAQPFVGVNWCDAWQKLSVVVFQGGQIADHKYFGMTGNAEIRLDQYAAGAIDTSSKFL